MTDNNANILPNKVNSIMDSVQKEFYDVLLENRENLIDFLYQNNSYQILKKSFEFFNQEQTDEFDHNVYQALSATGTISKKYIQSTVDWLPSKELVKGIAYLIKLLNINRIEEIYSPYGILSELLKREFDNSILQITTSNILTSMCTLKKIGYSEIAKRNVDDFKFYSSLNKLLPEMIISTFYPDGISDNEFIEDVIKLFNNDHRVILLILPYTFTKIYDVIYSVGLKNKFNIGSYHIKAVDKYFFVEDLLRQFYPSNMIMHVFVQSDVNIRIDDALEQAIFRTKNIDTRCILAKHLINYYPFFPESLTRSIVSGIEFDKPVETNYHFKTICDFAEYLKKINITKIPGYISEEDEFIFWTKCIINDLYLDFQNKEQFRTFYVRTITCLDRDTNGYLVNYPKWIKSLKMLYQFIYMKCINAGCNSKYSLTNNFSRRNKSNKKIICG